MLHILEWTDEVMDDSSDKNRLLLEVFLEMLLEHGPVSKVKDLKQWMKDDGVSCTDEEFHAVVFSLLGRHQIVLDKRGFISHANDYLTWSEKDLVRREGHGAEENPMTSKDQTSNKVELVNDILQKCVEDQIFLLNLVVKQGLLLQEQQETMSLQEATIQQMEQVIQQMKQLISDQTEALQDAERQCTGAMLTLARVQQANATARGQQIQNLFPTLYPRNKPPDQDN